MEFDKMFWVVWDLQELPKDLILPHPIPLSWHVSGSDIPAKKSHLYDMEQGINKEQPWLVLSVTGLVVARVWCGSKVG